MTEALLDMAGIEKTYWRGGKEIAALSDFSLSLKAGEVLGLLGPNGAGKTTAIKVLTSLCEPDQGVLRWRGEQVRNKRYLHEVGVLLEGRGSLNERLSTWENARYFCGLREASFDARYFADLVELMELPDVNAPVRQLSTGNKLKSALLLCVIHRPACVVLDEPTMGLDLFGVEKLETLVHHLSQAGTAIVISSHDLQFVEQLAKRIVCICRGRKLFDGPKSDFLRVEHAYVLKLEVNPGNAPLLPPLPPLRPGLAWVHIAPGSLRLELHTHAELCTVLALLMPALPSALGIQIERVTLKDKYLSLVGSEEEEDEGEKCAA